MPEYFGYMFDFNMIPSTSPLAVFLRIGRHRLASSARTLQDMVSAFPNPESGPVRPREHHKFGIIFKQVFWDYKGNAFPPSPGSAYGLTVPPAGWRTGALLLSCGRVEFYSSSVSVDTLLITSVMSF